MVIAQKPTEPLAALHSLLAPDVRFPREQQDIALALMIPLSMEVFDVFAQRTAQGALAGTAFFTVTKAKGKGRS